MSQTLVSVLLPVNNDEEFVEEALVSIRHQTHEAYEVIAIDDGSTDGSHQILERIAAEDDRVKVFRQKNMGLGSTLNKAIELARGELLARHDADDRSHPDRFRKQVQFLENHPGVSIVGTGTTVIDGSGDVKYTRPVATGNEILRGLLRSASPFTHGSVMMRRSQVIEAGCYPNIIWLEDLILWRAMARTGEIDNLDEPLYEYRVTPENLYVPRSLQSRVAKLFAERWPLDNFSDEDLGQLQEIRRQITPRVRKTQYHLNLAKGLLLNSNKKWEARKNLLQALCTNPLLPELLFQFALSWLPQSAVQAWRNRRTA